MLDIIDTIDIDVIITHKSWAGRWFWKTGNLMLGSDRELVDPQAIPTFVLTGTISKMPWNMASRIDRDIGFKFDDSIELAMRLSEYKLVNADQVVIQTKEAINKFYDNQNI